jgi:uncharacterized membrane protein YqjE
VSTPSEAHAQNPSVGELFSDVTKDVSLLVRQEIELAQAELRESATRAKKGSAELGAAGVAGHFGLLFLSLAVWWAIGNGIGRGWAALIVGVVYLVVAGVLASQGRKDLKIVPGLPQTAATAKRIPGAMKGNEGVR